MELEFNTDTEHWYIDTDKTYIKIVDKLSNKTTTENHRLGLVGQLEKHRIAAYENTYGMIAISENITTTHHFLNPDPTTNTIIWPQPDQ